MSTLGILIFWVVILSIVLSIDFLTDIELHSPSGSVNIVTFQYSTTADSASSSLEASVIRFCKEYDIQHLFCISLFSKALDFLITDFSAQFNNDAKGKFDPSTNVMSIEFYDKLKASLGVNKDSAFMETYNAVNRYSWAYRSERLNAFRAKLTSTDITGNTDNNSSIGNISANIPLDSGEMIIENEINQLIWNQFIENYNNNHNHDHYYQQYLSISYDSYFPQVCFIHACTLPDQDISILLEMLETIYTSGLAVTLTKLWIINHGTPLNDANIQKILEYNLRIAEYQQLSQQSFMIQSVNESKFNSSIYYSTTPVISLIERSTDMSRFEMTTLRHLHSFALQVNVSHENIFHTTNSTRPKDIQILYLHTKGITYKDSIRQSYTTDWRRVMMYFLVEKHMISYHLLASTRYDIIGINYHDNIPNGHEAHFAGNFWWVSAQYIINQIGTKLISLHSPKTVAELWLLKPKVIARVYNLHSSLIRHLYQAYPRELYAAADTANNNNNNNNNNDYDVVYNNIKIRNTAFAITIHNNDTRSI